MYDVIVIGSGISGLTFAHYAALKGKKVLILEKHDYAGGCIVTKEPYGGFYAELGAHSLYNSYATIIEMIENLNIKKNILPISKQPIYLYSNKLRSFISGLSIIGLIGGIFKSLSLKKGNLSVKDYYSGVFGKKNYERVFLPLFSAVICQDASEYMAKLVLKKRPKNKNYPRCFTFDKGMNRLVKTIIRQDNITVKFQEEVDGIIYNNGKYIVKTSKDSYETTDIAIAVHSSVADGLLKNINTQLSDHLSTLPVNETKAMMLAVKSNEIKAGKFSYIVSVNEGWRSAVSSDVRADNRYRAFTFHFKSNSNPVQNLDTLKNLFEIEDCQMQILEKKYDLPQLRTNHYEWLEQLDTIISNYKGLYLLGNFFGGLSLEDCAIRAKKQAEKFLETGVSK